MADSTLRDIDYAATAVKTAIEEKYGRKASLEKLRVTANERTISMQDGALMTENTRDNLLAAVRKAETYDELWRLFPAAHASTA